MRYLIVAAFIIVAFATQGCLYQKPQPQRICDTARIVTYSGDINRILNANCYRCHSRANAAISAFGIILEGYPALMKEVPQSLLNSINHTGGVVPMPRDGGKLDECEIAQIATWIRQGALNN